MLKVNNRAYSRKSYDGHKFGRWTIISDAENRGVKRYVNAVCDCGNRKETRLYGLTSGKSLSCGCLQKEVASKKTPAPVGKKFQMLTILREVHADSKFRKVEVQCECGVVKLTSLSQLINGHTKSCGCIRPAVIGRLRRTHGLSKTTEYQTWYHMIDRCQNPSNHAYRHYGGRGIKVCDRWQSFVAFYEDMHPRPDGKSIDRINNNKDYSPSNCRWASAREQQSNTRLTRFTDIGGHVVTFAEAARRLSVCPSTVSDWVSSGKLTEHENPNS